MLPQSKIPRLDAPIVLAHGLFGFTRIGLGRITLTPYFRSIPEVLTRAGNRVLVTRVPSIAGVERRAGRLGEQILKAFPNEPVHVIGHSMGGLDARRLLAEPCLAAADQEPVDDRHASPGHRAGGLRQVESRPHFPPAELDGNRSPRLRRRHPPRRPALQSQAPGAPGRRVYLGRRQPDARDSLLAPRRARSPHSRSSKDRTMDWSRSTRHWPSAPPCPIWPVDHLRQMNWMERDETHRPLARRLISTLTW